MAEENLRSGRDTRGGACAGVSPGDTVVTSRLDTAMRRATSDMARWREASHGLSATEAALVMGFALRVDLPDVVPPGFGVVARLPKAAIPPRSPAPAAPPAR